MKTFILSKEAFERGGNHLSVPLGMLDDANARFRLGYDPGLFGEIQRARKAFARLHQPHLPSLWDLHFFAASKTLSKQDWDAIYDESRSTLDPYEIEVFKDHGFSDIADLMAEFYALIDEIELEIIGRNDELGEPGYVEVANQADLEARRSTFAERLETLTQQHGLNAADRALSAIPIMAGVRLAPDDTFHRHWVDEIVAAPGFADYTPPAQDADDWYLNSKPVGWLTVRHGAALKAHGYAYQFAFWQQEIGYSRGHLWIQTDRGPLRLSDGTDSTSARSVFPVEVSTIHGEPLFQLEKTDVPDTLMGSGPDGAKPKAKGLFGFLFDMFKR